jgi:hypothetical protein
MKNLNETNISKKKYFYSILDLKIINHDAV